MAVSTIKGVETSSATLSGSYISGTWKVTRVGNIGFLQASNFASLPAGAFTIGTVPTEYRPKESISLVLVIRSSAKPPIGLSISTDGTLNGYNYGSAFSSATAIQATLSYPLA